MIPTVRPWRSWTERRTHTRAATEYCTCSGPVVGLGPSRERSKPRGAPPIRTSSVTEPATFAHHVPHRLELEPVFPSSVPTRVPAYSSTTHRDRSSEGSTWALL